MAWNPQIPIRPALVSTCAAPTIQEGRKPLPTARPKASLRLSTWRSTTKPPKAGRYSNDYLISHTLTRSALIELALSSTRKTGSCGGTPMRFLLFAPFCKMEAASSRRVSRSRGLTPAAYSIGPRTSSFGMSGFSAQSWIEDMAAAAKFVTPATRSEMSAVHFAFWLLPSGQSLTAKATS